MPFIEHQGLHYFTFESFPSGLIHGILTRKGGVSPEPWASLNLGGTVGDDPQRVRENRLRALEALGRSPDSVFDAWQVHGTGVFRADAPRPADMPHPKADILLTDRPQVTLLMRFADCVPIFLVDRRHGAIALIHAGWKGTVEGAAAGSRSGHGRHTMAPALKMFLLASGLPSAPITTKWVPM